MAEGSGRYCEQGGSWAGRIGGRRGAGTVSSLSRLESESERGDMHAHGCMCMYPADLRHLASGTRPQGTPLRAFSSPSPSFRLGRPGQSISRLPRELCSWVFSYNLILLTKKNKVHGVPA